MSTPGTLAAFFLAAGLLLVLLTLSRLRKRRLFAASRAAAGSGLCLALAALAFAVALNLYTYNRLTLEQPVASLRFEQIEPNRYRAYLHTPGAPTRSYVLAGSAWQLDARVVKWQPWATLLGFNALYRLDRLRGRYANLQAARQQRATLYAVYPSLPWSGLDIAQTARYLPAWLDPVDARFGSSTYLPMADGARYAVSISQAAGLVARPQNTAAKAAVRQW